MVFFELRWNYSPLKEKAVLLPDGLFICFCREQGSLHTAMLRLFLVGAFLLLMQAARRPRASRLEWVDKFVATLHTAMLRLFLVGAFLLLMQATRRPWASRLE